MVCHPGPEASGIVRTIARLSGCSVTHVRGGEEPAHAGGESRQGIGVSMPGHTDPLHNKRKPDFGKGWNG